MRAGMVLRMTPVPVPAEVCSGVLGAGVLAVDMSCSSVRSRSSVTGLRRRYDRPGPPASRPAADGREPRTRRPIAAPSPLGGHRP